ncbi:Tetratricopeptide repeat-containing protein [Marivirga sericea]|uniref:Tetratricopeptide repeat-containing protein n=1 Tax=Marivirga sericea TaxID=1028 RepID=A0A1X7KNC7_9BACT|nr:tetratricopeptide repeat protein [Marivirga sericea]SMG42860.1 Tetratricopeptide repeat-containing protein [Marivirga sericea]
MLKSRIILIVIAIALIAVFFSLPKVVVDNENESIDKGSEAPALDSSSEQQASTSADEIMSESHSGKIPEEIRQDIVRLRNSYELAKNQENSAIFADSLASVYRNLNRLDSAAKYVELSKEDNELIGNAYYEAFSFAADVDKAKRLAVKTREYLQKVLNGDPANNSAKIKLAMTYVSSDNPMQGISMLLEVVEEDPNNEEALFNLGILSIQSGQYSKAIERFEKLLLHHPDNIQAEFYLALSLMNNGQKVKARKLFTEIKNKSNDEQLLAAVESYLNEL